jgi:hypothetical protein
VAPDRPQLELGGRAIVLSGVFNPAIFQPVWLADNSLLRREETDEAEIGVIHPDVAAFNAGWLQLQVTRELFSATSSDPAAHELLGDFVGGVFRHQRPHQY